MKKTLFLILFSFISLYSFCQNTKGYVIGKVIFIGEQWYVETKETKTPIVLYKVLIRTNEGKFYMKTHISELTNSIKPADSTTFYCLLCDMKITSENLKKYWYSYPKQDSYTDDSMYLAYMTFKLIFSDRLSNMK